MKIVTICLSVEFILFKKNVRIRLSEKINKKKEICFVSRVPFLETKFQITFSSVEFILLLKKISDFFCQDSFFRTKYQTLFVSRVSFLEKYQTLLVSRVSFLEKYQNLLVSKVPFIEKISDLTRQ